MLDSGEVESGVDVEAATHGHVLTQGLGLRQPLDPGFCRGELSAGDGEHRTGFCRQRRSQ